MRRLHSTDHPVGSSSCLASPSRVLVGISALTAVFASTTMAGAPTPPIPPNVVVWGDGQCGLWSVPTAAYPIVQVSAGINHVAALRADGTVFVWGCHPGPPQGLSGVVQVAAGGHGHTAALLADGTLVMWGDNGDGQCNVPADLGPVEQVTCGAAHTVALLVDGTVRAWGNNGLGQCNVPPDLHSIVEVEAGGRHTLALRDDGTVVCWGFACAVPAGLSDVVAIDAGYDSALALRADGTVVCVAGGGPVCDVPFSITDATAVTAAVEGSAAINQTGRVEVWGNPSGSLLPPPNLPPSSDVTGGWGMIAALQPVDCDGDGLDDTVEMDSDPTLDCNRNWILDACELTQRFVSRTTLPFGSASSHSLTIDAPPTAVGAVRIEALVRADLAGPSRFVTVRVDGNVVASVFVLTGQGCDAGEQSAVVELPAASFNAAASDGSVTVSLTPSGAVSPSSCEQTWASLRIQYPVDPARPDCDSNGRWDACDISQLGVQDCNHNWIPDSCETDLLDCDQDGSLDVCQIAGDPSLDSNADGILDACQYARGDFTLDGQIDGADLSLLLSLWGISSPKIGDLSGDGIVGGADLSMLLGHWGPVKF